MVEMFSALPNVANTMTKDVALLIHLQRLELSEQFLKSIF
jgi:hypothetical protein